jgi:hypothetical protein
LLSECNIHSIRLLAQCLGIFTPIDIASSFTTEGSSTERLVNICRHFDATTYLAGAGGRDYMDMAVFEKAGISVRFQEFSPPHYPQQFCKEDIDFVAGLSAIDLLFNCGAESRALLMGAA